MRRTWLVAALVGAIAVAALVEGLRGDGDEPEAVRAASGLEGTLWLTAPGSCELRSVDLESGSVYGTGLSTNCRFWLSPRGDHAVVLRPLSSPRSGRGIYLAGLGDAPRLLRPLGRAEGDVAWAADGGRLAWCEEDGWTLVQSLEGGPVTRLPGCSPRFAASGAVITRSVDPGRRHLLADGEVLLYELELTAGLAPAIQELNPVIDILGFDEAPDAVLAVALRWRAAGRDGLLLELWRDGGLDGVLPLGRAGAGFGTVVRFSPGGRELAVAAPGPGGPLEVVELASLRTVLGVDAQDAFAWSPDGRWLAVAAAGGVALYGQARSLRDTLPLRATTLAWVT
jgi:hypothetical protein